jgi:N-acetylmuramic acid 6-phosphate etherase
MYMTNADDFLKQKHLFQLGDLPTETPHPKTVNLSELAKNDVERGLAVMREIDLDALRKIAGAKETLSPVFEAVAATLAAGDRIFLVGCGATGRLSLSLEYLWRRKNPQSEQVFSLMAGGDVALVHSLEGFEDFPEYGARHLKQLGFAKDDLLIATTEGGETPYVIGATEEAARASSRRPLFLYCNPPQILKDKVERSRRVLTNPKILNFHLETGPMALTGSTRMQASTVLMLVVGLALEYGNDIDGAFRDLRAWIKFLESSACGAMKSLIAKEAETYTEGNFTCYTVDHFAMTVFTDTTERAPTFNLAPFDNPKHLTPKNSRTYIAIPSAKDARSAWNYLLARTPRPLNWPEIHKKASDDYLYTFDFSVNALDFRRSLTPGKSHFEFNITSEKDQLILKFRGIEERFPLFGKSELFDHLTLKMLLNMHSTLTFGRLNRFEGNLMTWVYPSNGKLVDRAARYTQILLKKAGLDFSYDDIVRAQFKAKPHLSPSESIVHKTIEILSGQTQRLESRAPR